MMGRRVVMGGRAGAALAVHFNELVGDVKSGLLRRFHIGLRHVRVFNLLAATTDVAQKKNPGMGMADMGAQSEDIPALNLMKEAMILEKLQGPVHGRRRNGFALDFREPVDNRVSPQRIFAFAQDRQDTPPQRRQLQAFGRTHVFDLLRPAIWAVRCNRFIHWNRSPKRQNCYQIRRGVSCSAFWHPCSTVDYNITLPHRPSLACHIGSETGLVKTVPTKGVAIMSMRPMLLAAVIVASIIAAAISSPAFADPVKIVAAENFYGDIAQQIGGALVAVTSILTNPDQDPHLFEASTETARDIADAKIVIANGAGYDEWMDKLLRANKAAGRMDISVGTLVGRHAGDNPHLWYDPSSVKAAANAITLALVAVDPAHKADYEAGEANFIDSLKPLDAKIADMRKRFAGQPVTASEPVFGYQADLIGLKVHNETFAWAVMNNTEPSASEVANFENDLKGHKVKAMLFNAQASEPSVGRLVDLAKNNAIPVVGVSETEPPGMTYQQWMVSQLDALDKALASQAK